MSKKAIKLISLLLCFLLIFQQSGLAQVAGELDISGHLASLHSAFTPDVFRPLHLRYLSYNPEANNFQLFLDKGSLKNPSSPELQDTTKTLLNYFFVGLSLSNDTFWVNLRPDSPDQIIDDRLAQTDIGRIMLETDLQLKKDTALATSPETPEGRAYWDKLYKKAEELCGYENITIPTLTRPWIVPDEIIIRETTNSAYIYKATLKVMLEQDYLRGTKDEGRWRSTDYSFKDPRLKALNEYSTQLIRELIIPKLTKEVNSSNRYASLRQVYYSLIMAQWFKARFQGKQGKYYELINKQDLTNLTSKENWSKSTYFQAYQKSFKDGEYNVQEPVYTPTGQVIRSYFSGGEMLKVTVPNLGEIPSISSPMVAIASNKSIINLTNRKLIEINSSPSPMAQGASASSAVGESQTRREFLKMIGIGAVATAVTVSSFDKAIAASMEILGITSDVISEEEREIIETALKKLEPWELKVLELYGLVIEGTTATIGRGRAHRRFVIIDRQKGFKVDIILHEIGHTIQELITEAMEKKWLIDFVHNEIFTRNIKGVRDLPEGVEGVLSTGKDVNNRYSLFILTELKEEKVGDRLILVEGKNLVKVGEGDIEQILKELEKKNIEREVFYKAWEDQVKSGFVANWDTFNKENGLTYEGENWINITRKEGFVSPYASKNGFEDIAETYKLLRYNIDNLNALSKRDSLLAQKVELLEKYLKKLKDFYESDEGKREIRSIGRGGSSPIIKSSTVQPDPHVTLSTEEKSIPSGIEKIKEVPLPLLPEATGGIDFRSLPIVTQAVTNLSATISSSAIQNLVSVNLDQEWSQIKRMVSSGITPSPERIKEYIQASSTQDSITQDRDKIMLCISDILRLQEDRCESTNPTLRDILVVLESMSSPQELKQAFLGKAI